MDPESRRSVHVWVFYCLGAFLPLALQPFSDLRQVDTTPPRKGYAVLRASILLCWYSLFIRLIIENMTLDGKRFGYYFLKAEGRFGKLKDKIAERESQIHSLALFFDRI